MDKQCRPTVTSSWTAGAPPSDLDTSNNPCIPQLAQRAAQNRRQFLDELPICSGLSPKDVLFVLDGARPSLYDDKELQRVNRTYFGLMREYFLAEATGRGYYQEHGQRFEMPITVMVSPRFGLDHHWSPLGHQVAFEGVRNSRFFERFVRGCAAPMITATGLQPGAN